MRGSNHHDALLPLSSSTIAAPFAQSADDSKIKGRMKRTQLRSGWWMLLIICIANFPTRSTAQLRTIALIDATPALYLSARADFGDRMTQSVVVNLMFPPQGYEDLCELPEAYQRGDADIDRLPSDSTTPIALLVRRDACSPQTKAQVALQVQAFSNQQVRYIVVYSDDRTDQDVLYRLQPDRDTTFPELQAMEKMGILYIPFRYATSMIFRMRTQAALTGTSEIFYSAGNADWGLYAEIEPYEHDSDPQNPHGFDATQTTRFYWLRFILFTMLIVSPCLRAGYLWWAGGGRLHWRRNEHGRIVGIQYIP
jgi:hypothetical protein